MDRRSSNKRNEYPQPLPYSKPEIERRIALTALMGVQVSPPPLESDRNLKDDVRPVIWERDECRQPLPYSKPEIERRITLTALLGEVGQSPLPISDRYLKANVVPTTWGK